MGEPKEHFDVILVQPGVIWVYDPFEHLGLAYLAAALRRAGLTVKIVDAVLERLSMGDLYRQLDRYDISILGVTLISHGYRLTTRFLETYREAHPTTKIVGGGHFATFAAEKIFAHTRAFDAIVLGEGEVSFVEYCHAVLRGDGSQVPDVAYPGRAVVRSHNRILDMDALAFPARDNLALAVSRGATPSVTSSRGCYARCAFCTVHNFYQSSNGPRWIARSIDNVIAELGEMHARHGFDHFMFCDDNFMGPGRKGKELAIEFAHAYRRAKLPMTFHIDCRAVDVHEEVMAELKEAGLTSVFIGIESVSDADLKIYRKDLRSEANWNAIRILDKFGLQRTLAMIMFNPTTTPESIVANTNFLEQAEDFPRNPLSILNVYEGKPIDCRIFADHIKGPFWDYSFEFGLPSTRLIYGESLSFMKDTLPLERELSVRDDQEGRRELYRLRLRFLRDMASHAQREPVTDILARWRGELRNLRARLGATGPESAAESRFGGERLFVPPPEPGGAVCASVDTGEAATFPSATMGATPEP